MTRGFAYVALLTVGVACRGGASEPTPAPRPTRAATDASARRDNCALIDEAGVREALSLGREVTVRRGVPQDGRCAFYWARPGAAEIARRNEGRAREAMMGMARQMGATAPGQLGSPSIEGTPGALPEVLQEPTDFEASLFEAQRVYASPDEAAREFARGAGRLDRNVGGYRAETRPRSVGGVGDEALWTPTIHQLSVRRGLRVIHVIVNRDVNPERDLDAATTLARRALGGMGR